MRFNYIVDVYTKWYRSSFYFCATYACPGPQAISSSFETKFARMEYAGDGLFNLSYMRHTGKWFEIFKGLSIDECLETIRDFPPLHAIKKIHLIVIGLRILADVSGSYQMFIRMNNYEKYL